MPAVHLHDVLNNVRRTARSQESDARLLERYVACKDDVAFEILVRRHGPMVLGVCRRLLPRSHDAEDAFQATFLVLARKAASIRPRERLGSWLYGVAFRAAQKARASLARRAAREKQVKDIPEPATVAEGMWHDLEPLLDRELCRLPDKYRLPIVLCYLEGQTRKAAAIQLGWPEGTVAGRLARGRALLAKRLTRQGLPLSGCVLAAVLSQNVVSACVSVSLVHSTVRDIAGVVSPQVVALAEGVQKTMLLGKLKIVAAVFFSIVLVSVGVGTLPHPVAAEDPSSPPDTSRLAVAPERAITVRDVLVEGVDVTSRTITVAIRKKGVTWQDWERAAADSDTAKARLEVARAQEARMGDLLDKKAIDREVYQQAVASRQQAEAILKALASRIRQKRPTRMEGLPVAKDARIVLGREEVKLSELKAKMRISLRLATDGEQVIVTGIFGDK